MLYDNELWNCDIDKVLNVVPDLDALSGKSVLITGATGLICSAVVDVLLRYNDAHDNKIDVFVAGRNLEKMKRRFTRLSCRSDLNFVMYDASRFDNEFNCHVDYIVHGASNAYPGLIVKEPVETLMSNVLGTKCLLDLAKEQGVKRFLFISSSEVYGLNNEASSFKENQYGFIDLLNSRNSYSLGKRAAETLCASYYDEYGIESVIVRPGHIYGPTASINDNRVSSAWAFSAARGEDIVMKSDGSQLRSYCYCLDCASAILKVLLSGENKHAYNISNPNSVISIRRMAEILSQCAGIKLVFDLPTEIEKRGFNPMSNSSLDSTCLLNLGWHGCFDAETGFRHTVDIIKSII